MDHTVEFSGTFGISNHQNYINPTVNIREGMRRELAEEWEKHLQVKRKLIPLKFGKGRLRNNVFTNMRSYYYNNRNPPHMLPGGMGLRGSLCQSLEIRHQLHTWHLKHIWQEWLKMLFRSGKGVKLSRQICTAFGSTRMEQG